MNRAQRRRAARKATRDPGERKAISKALAAGVDVVKQQVPVLPTGQQGVGRTPSGLYVPTDRRVSQ